MQSTQNDKASIKENAATPQKSSNKTIFWILGGCLALLLIAGLIAGGMAYWGYKKVKKEIRENQPKVEQWQSEMEKIKQETEKNKEEVNPTFEEEPQPEPEANSTGMGELPANSERQMGYIKKVYPQNGKNYLDIDYIQWLTGDVAEKAMREDGECPKTGECIVLDDYYIRNQNSLIRTFEISPDVQIFMQTYGIGEEGGDISWNQPITFNQLRRVFDTNSKPHLKSVPYIVEIQNKKIVKITEQYIP